MPANFDQVVKESSVLVTIAEPVHLGSLPPVHCILADKCIVAIVEGFKLGSSPSVVYRCHLLLHGRDFSFDFL